MRLSRQDFTLAVRSFARYPGFTITAVLSLALAIALNTTMYSVLDALVNPEINARAPSRLYSIQIWGDYKHRVDNAARAAMLREMASVSEAMTYTAGGMELGVEYANRYAQVQTQTVAPNYFDVMRIGPVRGRSFTDADLAAEMTPVIISERLAATLSPDRDLPLGARIDVDGRAHSVIGIVHHGAQLFMLPTTPVASLPPNLIRLRDGVTGAEAEGRLSLLSNRFSVAANEGSQTGFLLQRADAGQFHLANFHFALIAAVVGGVDHRLRQSRQPPARARHRPQSRARAACRARRVAPRHHRAAAARERHAWRPLGCSPDCIATFWGMHLIAARIPPSVASTSSRRR